MSRKRPKWEHEMFASRGPNAVACATCQFRSTVAEDGGILDHAGTDTCEIYQFPDSKPDDVYYDGAECEFYEPADDKPLSLLLGVAVGDALGVPVEFKKRGTFHVAGMQGYGTHNQPPGTWSDDTSLTLALADNLLPDRCSLESIATGFQLWYFNAWYTPHGKVFDVGNATAKAIKRLKDGVAPEKAGGIREKDNGNGSLMRISPLTFYMYGVWDRANRYEIVKRVSSMTHAHEWSVTACFIYVEMLNKILKGRDKWWLAISTLLAILLAWGSHFMWFTKLWYDLAPLYNKFRTVSMALVILQVTVPLLGFLALDKIWKEEKGNRRIRKAALAAYGITGGVCLLFALFPSLAGTFAGSSDAGMQDVLSEALRADRKSMLVKDAFRSLVFVTLAFGLICWNLGSSGKEHGGKTFIPAGIAMAVLILIDLWGVDKRYLNSSHFTSRRDFSSQFEARPVDKIILEDKSLDYRVLDLSVNTFNDSHTSYWHKSIGGYSPAKMQRYQDLIEHHLTGEINDVIRTVNSSATIQDVEAGLPELPVLSMLNDKYIILGGEYPPVENRQAFGNCWIVSSAAAAATPDEEIAMLSGTDLRSTAIIGNDFAWAREKLDSLGRLATHDIAPADSVWMTSYAPNELRYRSRTHSEKAVIFSEIYYPEGWTLTIDGTPADIFRADWILRGAFIPAGEHEIVMRFEPQAYSTGAALSRASSITLYILLILSGAGLFVIRRKNES